MAAAALRIMDHTILNAVGPATPGVAHSCTSFPPPVALQMQSAVAAFRYMDCQFGFPPEQARLLLRMLRFDSCAERKRWFEHVCACRRRPQGRIANLRRTGIEPVWKSVDEYVGEVD
jgi:hypothetical protein